MSECYSLTVVQHSILLCPPSSSSSSEMWDRNTALCDWILNLLTGWPQSVWIDSTISCTSTLNNSASQGCIHSPLLYSLFMHNCVAAHSSNTIIRFSANTTIINLIILGTTILPVVEFLKSRSIYWSLIDQGEYNTTNLHSVVPPQFWRLFWKESLIILLLWGPKTVSNSKYGYLHITIPVCTYSFGHWDINSSNSYLHWR